MFRNAVCLLLCSLAAPVAAEEDAAAVEVIGVTPLPGMGVPRGQFPANVQSVGERELEEAQAANLPEFLFRRMPGVTVSDVQGNPFQPDVSFRGFTASPLLGAPQGLSVYQDGVRINAPFGDIVHWDLVPMNAIDTMTLVPGSNPLFGANTLGGALSLRTRSGERNPGLEMELTGGSFGRRDAELEYGRRLEDGAHLYAAGKLFKENGWRDFSPSDVRQLFAKFGKRDARFDFDVGVTLADNSLTGNGLAPQGFLAQRRQAIFTHPDTTQNRMGMVALNGRYALSADEQLAGTLYLRRIETRTLNADVNAGFEGGPDDAGAGGSGANVATGVNHRGSTTDGAAGGALQWSLATSANRIAVGGTADLGRSDFAQSSELGVFDPTRGVAATDPQAADNGLRSRTRAASLFVTDTYALRDDVHATLAGRYNWTQVGLRDTGPSAPALDGDHSYTKLNPALGLTWQAAKTLNLYGGFTQGSRAPTPIELGCADPNRPCTLPNALSADPSLKQVVAQTWEFGARGRAGEALRWNAGLFQTDSRDDILFVGTTTSAGYFTNFGKTRRRGAELGASGALGGLRWNASYAFVRATYQSFACLVSENNSSRGTAAECSPADPANPGMFLGDDLIAVRPGERIPGIPEHSLKLALEARAAERLTAGFEVLAFSDQVVRGNENNQHQAGTFADLNGQARSYLGSGTLPGYAVVGLVARLDLGGGWQLQGKIANLFDKRYASAGALAQNPFGAAGAFQTDSTLWTRETFSAPGAPRAIWIGVRYQG